MLGSLDSDSLPKGNNELNSADRNAYIGQLVITLAFIAFGAIYYAVQYYGQFSSQLGDISNDSPTESISSSCSPPVPELVPYSSTQNIPKPTMKDDRQKIASEDSSQKKIAVADLEIFLRKLREEGIAVLRLKNKVLSPRTLRLNDKGELFWAKSWFPKPIALKNLVNVIDPLDSNGGFVLEFSCHKILNLRIPEHEFPIDTFRATLYFRALLKQILRDKNFVQRFVTAEAASKPFVEDEIEDSKSEISELTTTTVNTSSRPAINIRINGGHQK